MNTNSTFFAVSRLTRTLSLCFALALTLPLLFLGCETTRASSSAREGSAEAETSAVRSGAGPDARVATVTVPQIPSSVEAFRAWRDEVATTPEGGAATWIVALYLYTQDEELGNACLTMQADRSHLVEAARDDEAHYRGHRIHGSSRDALESTLRPSRQPFVPASYFEGTSWQTGYALPQPPRTITFRIQREDDESARLFVFSSGADRDRPISMKRNNRGIWKAYEWSTIVTGIREPQQPEIDDDF